MDSLVGDPWLPIFFLNALSVYLFLPLPLVLLATIALRNYALTGASLAAVAAFFVLWGAPLLPRSTPPAEGPVLTVMTYNLLGGNNFSSGVVEALRASDADVIALQELDPDNAAAIADQLAEAYPYQVLRPGQGGHGAGMISRLPMQLTGETLRDRWWTAQPIIASVAFDGRSVVVIDVHAAATSLGAGDREHESRLLQNYVDAHDGPVVLAGDFNATDRNHSYEILRETLHDAWRDVGHGFGHTFPGASKQETPSSARAELFGISVPRWLVRIDYVFYTDELRAVQAGIGPWDGHSDHRPTIAKLTFR